MHVHQELTLAIEGGDQVFHDNEGGFSVDFPNGWTVSVQWAGGDYGDNHPYSRFMPPSDGWKSRTAEVAAWRTNARQTEKWYDGYDCEDFTGVRGWQDAGEVVEYMEMISGMRDKPQPRCNAVNNANRKEE